MAHHSVAIFDLGGVVIDWNPRYLYRKLFNGDEQRWNTSSLPFVHRRGTRSKTPGDRLLMVAIPLSDFIPTRELIDAWFQRYEEMLGGEIPGTVDILRELRPRSVPIYALNNWSAETFPIAVNRFECLSWFNGMLLSGEVRLLKPDRRIFEIFLDTFRIEPSSAIYIDDRSENVEAAVELGMCGIVFRDSRALRAELTRAGVIVD